LFAFMTIAVSRGHVIASFDLPGQLLASKTNGELYDSLNDHVVHLMTTAKKAVKSVKMEVPVPVVVRSQGLPVF